MCTAFIAWKIVPSVPLLTLSNRDEFHKRPALAAAWDESDTVLGGVDLEAGGRWLGVNRHGAFAVLLNVRDISAIRPDAASRGSLVDNFLSAEISAYEYAEQLYKAENPFNPYNLLLCDGDELVFYSNHNQQPPRRLPPGLYGVSNGGLDEAWPKVANGKAEFSNLLQNWSAEAGFALLANRDKSPDDELPATGVPLEFERLLSSLFIVSEQYGTRASTLVSLSKQQNEFYERSFNPQGQPIDEKHYRF